MSHISPAESRLMARARLSQVLSEKRDEEAKAQVEFEQTRATQIEHVLSLKMNIAAEQNREHELNEIRKRKKRAKQKSLESLRADLEARGINADAVILEREEFARQEKERKARIERDQANSLALQKQLAREDAMRRTMLSREAARHAQSETLRKKVSRNLIEVSVEQLKRRKARQAERAQSVTTDEHKEESLSENSADPSSSQSTNEAINQSESITADQADRDSVQELDSFDPNGSSPKQPKSYSLIAPITHLQHYQQQAHRTKLAERLNESIYHHQHHERQPIMGKSYQSSPFVAAPPTVAFIDIEHNISQTISLTVTNTSFTFTNVQLMPLSGQLADCCTVNFTPPGRLSSGQSFTVRVTLTPIIEQELIGSIDFISECGPFSVPVTASMRKAVVSVDREEVILKSVLGDHDRGLIKLTNDGARAVNFVYSLINCRHIRPTEDEDDEIILSYQPVSVGISSLSRPDTVALQSGTQQSLTETTSLSPEHHLNPSADQSQLPSVIHPSEITTTPVTNGEVVSHDLTAPLDQPSIPQTTRPKTSGKRIHRLEAYSEVTLIVHFKPRFTASSSMDLVVECTDPDEQRHIENTDVNQISSPEINNLTPIVWGSSRTMSVKIVAEGADVPVYVSEPLLSFGACVSDKLYRSSVKLYNRSNQAHRFNMVCPSALNSLISFLPVLGYVQPHDSIDVQVKLRVPISHEDQVYQLLYQAGVSIDPADQAKGIIIVPMIIDVNGQTLPVQWTLKARLTTSLISLALDQQIQQPTHLRTSRSHVDPQLLSVSGPFSPRALMPDTPFRLSFGSVVIGQSGAIAIKLTNHSIIMQKVSFVGLPPYCSVLTNTNEIDDSSSNEYIEQGLINLMPLRSYSVNICFSPVKATNHHWTFTLKSSLNQTVQLECRGTGAKCPVVVDRTRISMRAVCEGDVDIASFWVTNTSNQTKVLQFVPPSDPSVGAGTDAHALDRTNDRRSFLSFHPSVLSLNAGSSTRVHVQFRPLFDNNNSNSTSSESAVVEAPPSTDGEHPKHSNKADKTDKADKSVAQPAKKGKAKKIDAAEQARLDEEARLLEEQRLADESRLLEEQRIAQQKVEADRIYNSVEARQARQRANPINQLIDCSLMEWNDTDTREPFSRRARHRIAICAQSVKKSSKLPLIGSVTQADTSETDHSPVAVSEQQPNPEADHPVELPVIDTGGVESSESAVLVVDPKFSVFFMQITTCIANSPLSVSFESASSHSPRHSGGPLDFGPMSLDNAAVRYVTVTNVSAVAQVVTLIGLDLPFHSLGPCLELFLEPRQCITHPISFKPLQEKCFEALTHFICRPALDETTHRSNSLSTQRSTGTSASMYDPALNLRPNEIRVPITLIGQGVNPTFKLSHQKLAFACLSVNQSITQSVTITNTSPYPLHLAISLIDVESTDRNIGSQPVFQWICNEKIVEPGHSVSVSITFTADIMSLRFYANMIVNQSVIELHGVCSQTPLFMVSENDRHRPRLDMSLNQSVDQLVTGRRFMDALREPVTTYQPINTSALDAAFKSEPVEKPTKVVKGKNDKDRDKVEAVTVNGALSQAKLLPMFSKLSLYEYSVLPLSERPWLVHLLPSETHSTSIVSFHFSTGSGIDEKSSTGSFECLIGKLDVLDEFFSVSQSNGSIKPGESVSLTISFDQRRFLEWKQTQGKQIWDQSLNQSIGRSRPFAEGVARVMLRYQSGEKGAQPVVSTQLIALRADIVEA